MYNLPTIRKIEIIIHASTPGVAELSEYILSTQIAQQPNLIYMYCAVCASYSSTQYVQQYQQYPGAVHKWSGYPLILILIQYM